MPKRSLLDYTQFTVQSFARATPSSLTNEQISLLVVLYAGPIYQMLKADRVALAQDLSAEEAAYYVEHLVKPDDARSDALIASTSSPKIWCEAFDRYRVANWQRRQFSYFYREQRIAEQVKTLLRSYPATKNVALVFGAAHNMEPSIRRLNSEGIPISLERRSWNNSQLLDSFFLDRFSTQEEQIRFASAPNVEIPLEFALTFLDSEAALRIALQKHVGTSLPNNRKQMLLGQHYLDRTYPNDPEKAGRLAQIAKEVLGGGTGKAQQGECLQ